MFVDTLYQQYFIYSIYFIYYSLTVTYLYTSNDVIFFTQLCNLISINLLQLAVYQNSNEVNSPGANFSLGESFIYGNLLGWEFSKWEFYEGYRLEWKFSWWEFTRWELTLGEIHWVRFSWWDYPSTTLILLLCFENNLLSPSYLISVNFFQQLSFFLKVFVEIPFHQICTLPHFCGYNPCYKELPK